MLLGVALRAQGDDWSACGVLWGSWAWWCLVGGCCSNAAKALQCVYAATCYLLPATCYLLPDL